MEELVKQLLTVLNSIDQKLESINDCMWMDRCDNVCSNYEENHDGHIFDCIFYELDKDFSKSEMIDLENLFNSVKEKVNIVDLISEYTYFEELENKKTVGLCVFCNNNELTINPDKQVFYCYSCNIGGDVITFYSKIENISPINAVNLLKDKYKVGA